MNQTLDFSEMVALLAHTRERLSVLRHDKKASSQFLIELMDQQGETVISQLETMDKAQRQLLVEAVQMPIPQNADGLLRTFKKTPRFARVALIRSNIQRILTYLNV